MIKSNDRTARSRGMLPKGITMRKVRASKGRITDNVRRRRLPGKCNRDIPPAFWQVRVERRGKSSPIPMVTQGSCKPYPKQHRMRNRLCRVPARHSSAGGRGFYFEGCGNVAHRQMIAVSLMRSTEPGLQVRSLKKHALRAFLSFTQKVIEIIHQELIEKCFLTWYTDKNDLYRR